MRQSVPWFHSLDDGVEELAVDVVEDATHRGICFFAVAFFDPMEFPDVAPAYGPFVLKACALRHNFLQSWAFFDDAEEVLKLCVAKRHVGSSTYESSAFFNASASLTACANPMSVEVILLVPADPSGIFCRWMMAKRMLSLRSSPVPLALRTSSSVSSPDFVVIVYDHSNGLHSDDTQGPAVGSLPPSLPSRNHEVCKVHDEWNVGRLYSHLGESSIKFQTKYMYVSFIGLRST